MRKILYCLLFAVILVSCDDSVIKPEEYISKAVLEDFHNRYPGVKYNTVIGSDGDATFTVIDELGCKGKVHYYEGKSYFLVIDSEGTVLERKDDHLIRQDNRFLPDKMSHYLKARSMAQEKHPSATIKGMVFYSGAFVLYLSEGYSIFAESFRYGECDPCYDKQ